MGQGAPFRFVAPAALTPRQGAPFRFVASAALTPRQGAPFRFLAGPALPMVFQGPPLQHVAETLLTTAQGPPLQHDIEALGTVFQGPPLQHDTEGSPVTAPVVDNVTAVQRDTAQTFLVDVGFEVSQAQSLDVDDILVEFSDGSAAGPWTTAQAQSLEFRHTAELPVTGIPASAPGKKINYVWNAFFDLPEGVFTEIFVRLSVTVNPTTIVVVGPVTVVTTPAEAPDPFTQQLARRSILARTPFDHLGNGLLIPFRRGSRDFVSGRKVELIRSAVRQILGTRATHGRFPGELPWRPDFGSKLWVLRHRQNSPTLRGQALTFVQEALRWEPRVEVTDVFVEREPFALPNELRIRYRYRIIEENRPGNRVILPEFEEELLIGSAT